MPEPATQPTTEKTPTQPPDHHQCRHLKMDGVRCGRQVPLGHPHCYHHRFNRDPTFVRHHGNIRVPLLEDVASLQVTTTAAIHALLNQSLDRRDVRAILTAVKVATGVLRFDLAERRFLAQTGQTRPEPVTDFAILGHERVAVEDPIPAAVSEPATCNLQPETCNLKPVTCTPHPVPSNLDPADDFLTPETILALDEELRVPLPAPGQPDPLRIDGKDWPCPYRFNYCKGPGPKASCHYCTGQMRWEDVHPNEPDPGAPGPLPTTQSGWPLTRDIVAPAVSIPTSLHKKENSVILSEPSEFVAPEGRVGRVESPESDLETDRWLSARTPLPDGEEWLPALTPLDPEPETIPVLVASATPGSSLPAPGCAWMLPMPTSRITNFPCRCPRFLTSVTADAGSAFRRAAAGVDAWTAAWSCGAPAGCRGRSRGSGAPCAEAAPGSGRWRSPDRR